MEIVTFKDDTYACSLKTPAAPCIPIFNEKTKKPYWEKSLLVFIEIMKNKLINTSNALAISSNQLWRQFTVPPCVFVMKIHDNVEVFINPIIKGTGKQIQEKEGCLSFPNKIKLKKRHKNVTMLYQTIDSPGEQFAIKVTELSSRVIQHEVDHLRGITLFTFKPYK